MASDERIDLGGIELLSRLSGQRLRRLERDCLAYEFAAGQIIFGPGGHATHHVYFVATGIVRIVNYAPSGREIAFANVHEGGYFGELGALTNKPRSASAIAVTDCRLVSLAPPKFEELLIDNPELALQVIRQLSDMVQRCDKRIMDLSTLDAVQRIHVDLMRLARPDPGAPECWIVRPMPTISEIAGRASTSRPTVSRALRQLTVAGVIDRKGKTLYVRDRDRLAEFAENGISQTIAAQ